MANSNKISVSEIVFCFFGELNFYLRPLFYAKVGFALLHKETGNRILKSILLAIIFIFCHKLSINADTVPITILYTSCNKGYFLPYKIYESAFFDGMKLKIGDQFGGYAAIAHYMKKIRKEVESNKGIFLIFDTGNSLYGCYEANFFKGETSIDFKNRIGYDAVTIGNLDFNMGKKNLYSLINKAKFPLLSANLFIKDSNKHPDKILPYTIIEKNGLKIGVIGYAQDRADGMLDVEKIKGWELRTQIPSVKKYVDDMKNKGADLIISVDHADGYIYKDIIDKVDGIDVLIESASEWATTWGYGFSKEFFLKEHDTLKNTRLFHEVDSHFAIGRADLVYDKTLKKIIHSTGSRYFMNLNEVDEDTEIKKIVNKYSETYFELVGKKLQEVIGFAEADITSTWDSHYTSAPLGSLISTALKEYTKSDIGIENIGGVRRHIRKGPIKVKDVEDALPFGNKIVTFKVRGKDIYKIYLLGFMAANCPFPWYYITGLEITRDTEYRIIKITADGKEISKKKIYSFAVNSFLYNCNYLNQPECFDFKVWDVKESEAVIDFIRKNSPISLSNRETGCYYQYIK